MKLKKVLLSFLSSAMLITSMLGVVSSKPVLASDTNLSHASTTDTATLGSTFDVDYNIIGWNAKVTVPDKCSLSYDDENKVMGGYGKIAVSGIIPTDKQLTITADVNLTFKLKDHNLITVPGTFAFYDSDTTVNQPPISSDECRIAWTAAEVDNGNIAYNIGVAEGTNPIRNPDSSKGFNVTVSQNDLTYAGEYNAILTFDIAVVSNQ